MALHLKNDPSKYLDCKKSLINQILKNLKNLKKPINNLTENELFDIGQILKYFKLPNEDNDRLDRLKKAMPNLNFNSILD